ncbi:MAG: hypothetical protein ABIR17_11665 [Pseudolysinimonas sp.]
MTDFDGPSIADFGPHLMLAILPGIALTLLVVGIVVALLVRAARSE